MPAIQTPLYPLFLLQSCTHSGFIAGSVSKICIFCLHSYLFFIPFLLPISANFMLWTDHKNIFYLATPLPVIPCTHHLVPASPFLRISGITIPLLLTDPVTVVSPWFKLRYKSGNTRIKCISLISNWLKQFIHHDNITHLIEFYAKLSSLAWLNRQIV